MVDTRTPCFVCGFDMFWLHTKEYETQTRYELECVRCQETRIIGTV